MVDLSSHPLTGVVAAIPTPVSTDFVPNAGQLIDLAERLLAQGCHGINLLGTTGEAVSFTRRERVRLMEDVSKRGDLVARMMVGTGAAAFDDAVELTRVADRSGYRAALVLPPFYYKNITQKEIADWVSFLIDRAAPRSASIYLYNFPQMTGLTFERQSVALLRERFGEVVAGLKDSSGNRKYAAELASLFPGFAVFPSNEALLAERVQDGFAGCISASVNASAALARAVHDDPVGARISGVVDQMNAIRTALTQLPLVPALKALVGSDLNDGNWARTVPPLEPLDETMTCQLMKAVTEIKSGQKMKVN
ncbi:hypothetical protein B0E33_18670 [Roseibium algicola]|uniref:4-hydroxy-tetrahydrodipicolinate synthase n=1 Tax=Roseibium algicola TaxID=2857014 RepID=A0ABM6I4K7_9HYPH|nr:dihydrodipicolinate synthase family protein [Roseibium aggregatum]AQQ05351.1 hypothetical protein B0E33_18670 [Roseibium aggregatum]